MAHGEDPNRTRGRRVTHLLVRKRHLPALQAPFDSVPPGLPKVRIRTYSDRQEVTLSGPLLRSRVEKTKLTLARVREPSRASRESEMADTKQHGFIYSSSPYVSRHTVLSMVLHAGGVQCGQLRDD